MPLCGFNEKMLKGLSEFNEGLVEHGLLYRSDIKGETVDQAIQRELSDMSRFLNETHRIDNTAQKLLTESLANYAMAFYLIVKAHGVNEYKELTKNICEYFRLMDEKYYRDLEGNRDDMRELAEYLNEKGISHPS